MNAASGKGCAGRRTTTHLPRKCLRFRRMPRAVILDVQFRGWHGMVDEDRGDLDACKGIGIAGVKVLGSQYGIL